MSVQEPQRYRYNNPAEVESIVATFDIVPSTFETDAVTLAQEFQEVRRIALRGAYNAADFTDEELALSVGGHDPKHVAEETKQIKAAARTDRPYVYACFPGVAPGIPGPDGQRIGYVAGFGHIQQVKGGDLGEYFKAAISRKGRPAETVDVGAVFTKTGLQGKGIGQALLLGMVDLLPDDTQITAVLPAVNRGAKLLLVDRLGFKIAEGDHANRSRVVHGKAYNHTRYEGPVAGELRQQLVDLNPWFNAREPV